MNDAALIIFYTCNACRINNLLLTKSKQMNYGIYEAEYFHSFFSLSLFFFLFFGCFILAYLMLMLHTNIVFIKMFDFSSCRAKDNIKEQIKSS